MEYIPEVEVQLEMGLEAAAVIVENPGRIRRVAICQ
jgi:hypothetical protein